VNLASLLVKHLFNGAYWKRFHCSFQIDSGRRSGSVQALAFAQKLKLM
jgi:hypothetical protein